MKNKSILSFAAATSLTAAFVSLFATQDLTLSCSLLAVTMTTVIALHDYTPRSYFVITASVPPRATPRQSPSPFSTSLGLNHRKLQQRPVGSAA